MSSGQAVREGFPRDDRLRKRREFEECYSSGVRVSGRHLQVFFLFQPPSSRPRLGISVPKRVGNAVTRNRVRRRVREIFRKSLSAFGSTPARIVVNVRPSAARETFASLSEDYLSAIAKALSRRNPRR